MKIPLWIVGIVVGLTVAFVVTDCSAGRSQPFTSIIIGRNYVAAWTEISTSTDADGNVSITCHPEEYHLIAKDSESERLFDVQTRKDLFFTVTNNQYVIVNARVGRWTKAAYLPTIQLYE